MIVLACLLAEERKPMAVLEAASSMAEELGGRAIAVHVGESRSWDARAVGRNRLLADELGIPSWFLRSDEPVPALVRFARSRGAARLLLGPDAWARFGDLLRDTGGPASVYQERVPEPRRVE